MNRRLFVAMLGSSLGASMTECAKAREQRSVQDAVVEFGEEARQRFGDWQLATDGSPITLVAYKKERRLEVWKQSAKGWRRLKVYRFTASSGALGPKLREGDKQIPEGVYEVEGLNPNSSYHLSIRVNYPNAFDREVAEREGRTNLGGDIYIHGKDVTIGCIPIGDAAIEELFVLLAENGWQGTRIIIAPHRLLSEADFPSIRGVTWDKELYQDVLKALQSLQKKAISGT